MLTNCTLQLEVRIPAMPPQTQRAQGDPFKVLCITPRAKSTIKMLKKKKNIVFRLLTNSRHNLNYYRF